MGRIWRMTVMVMMRMKTMAMNRAIPMCYAPIYSNPIHHLINLWGGYCHKYCICDMHPVQRTEAQAPGLSLTQWEKPELQQNNLSFLSTKWKWSTGQCCWRRVLLHSSWLPRSLQQMLGTPHILNSLFVVTRAITWCFCQEETPWQRTAPQIVIMFICENVCETCSHRE